MKLKKLLVNTSVFIVITSICCILTHFILMGIQKSNADKTHYLYVSQFANGSAGEWWSYELSTDTILKESYYKENSVFGPGYRQIWHFEIIGEGEVTITWIPYKEGTLHEADAYNVTYLIDSEGSYTQKVQ